MPGCCGDAMTILPLPNARIDEIFDLYAAFDGPTDPHLPKPKASALLDQLRRQDGEIFVAEIDGRLAGTYSIYLCQNLRRSGRPFGVIENVVCLPDYRRQGIGRALMAHGIAHAQANHCYKVMLATGLGRPENHAFYEACGFRNDKRAYQVRFGA